MSTEDDVKRIHFDEWKECFVQALQGAAGSSRMITNIVDDAVRIADLAVAKIAERVPKDSGR